MSMVSGEKQVELILSSSDASTRLCMSMPTLISGLDTKNLALGCIVEWMGFDHSQVRFSIE